MRNKNLSAWTWLSALLLLVACTKGSSNPSYFFAPGEGTALVRLLNIDKATMCKDGKLYDIVPEIGNNLARIPVGTRITLGTLMVFRGEQGKLGCEPRLSFIPVDANVYVVHNVVRGNSCFLELVREDEDSRVGLGPEPSTAPPNCEKDQK